MKEDKRFVSIYKHGAVDVIEVLVDKETGVNYIYRTNGYAGGMTVLLDKNGKPIVTHIESK
ncbi:MAG: DUF6440 family protein [Clostridia bacterium]|nr:DUF6440 family protein [Clostridia bacterium]